MAVVSVNKLFIGRGGTDTFSRQRTYREVYEVVTDDPTDNEAVVTAVGTGIPRLGTPHVSYPYARCVEMEADQSEDTPYIWHVSLKYDSKFDLPNSLEPSDTGDGSASQSPADISENPLLRPMTWRVGYGGGGTRALRYWRPVVSDALLPDAYLILNSAGLPFDPPLTVEESRLGLSVTVNVAGVSLAFLNQLNGAVNDRLWRGQPKWTAKICNVDAANKYENGVAYVELSFRIEIEPYTWVTEVLDSGLYEKAPRPATAAPGSPPPAPVPKWTRIRDPFGNIASDAQPLNGSGRALQPGDAPVYLRGLARNLHEENFATLLPGL